MARCTVIGRVHATDLSMSPGKRDSIFRNSQYDRFAGCLWVLAKRSPRSFQRQSGGSPGVLPRAGDIFSYPAVSIHGETTLKGFLSDVEIEFLRIVVVTENFRKAAPGDEHVENALWVFVGKPFGDFLLDHLDRQPQCFALLQEFAHLLHDAQPAKQIVQHSLPGIHVPSTKRFPNSVRITVCLGVSTRLRSSAAFTRYNV